MGEVISLLGRKAEERLARMHQIKRAGKATAKMLMDTLRVNDPEYCMYLSKTEFIPMSFTDIGMNSSDELVKEFALLDAAVAAFNSADIERHLARLLGEEHLNIKLVRQ